MVVKLDKPLIQNMAELHEQLGWVPLNRIRTNPPPGTATEEAALYREWRLHQISAAEYLVAVKGLGEHRTTLTSVETHQRAREQLEHLNEKLERSNAQTGSALPYLSDDPTVSPANGFETQITEGEVL